MLALTENYSVINNVCKNKKTVITLFENLWSQIIWVCIPATRNNSQKYEVAPLLRQLQLLLTVSFSVILTNSENFVTDFRQKLWTEDANTSSHTLVCVQQRSVQTLQCWQLFVSAAVERYHRNYRGAKGFVRQFRDNFRHVNQKFVNLKYLGNHSEEQH